MDSFADQLRDKLLLQVYIPSVLFSMAVGMLVPVLPIFLGEFGVPYWVIGVVIAGEDLGTLLTDVPSGMLIRRLGNRRVMILGLAGHILASMALFIAPSVLAVLALRMFSGVGRSLYNLGRHHYLAEGIQRSSRGKAIGSLGGVFRMGAFIGPAIGGSVAAAFGLRAAFIAAGAAGLLAMVFVVRFVPFAAPDPNANARAQLGKVRNVVAGNAGLLTAAGLGQLLAMSIRRGRSIILPLVGADLFGLDVQTVGFVMSASFGVDASLFFTAGLIMDNLGRKWAIVPSFVLQGLAMALIPIVGGFWGLLGVGVLYGLANSFSSGTMMTLGADLAPQAERGEFLGVWRLIGDAGAMTGPVAVGVVADLLVLPAAALVLAAAGWSAALTFGLFVPETLQPEAAAAD